MLHFSRLKAGMILCVCLLGILLSIPSFTSPGRLPAWYPQPRVNLGLDLQGGSYLLLGLRLNHSQKASAVAMATPDRKLAASLS